MARTVESVVNAALRRLGSPHVIGSILEGSPIARAALDVYGQTRDDLLRSEDWGFARAAVGLTPLKTAPAGGYGYGNPWTTAYPPPPWVYEYAYPVACVEVRSVRPTPIIIPEYDPQPNRFVTAIDNALSPPAKVVLCNLAHAQAVITGQVNDLSIWDAGAIEELIDALAVPLGKALAPEAQYDQERLKEVAMAEQTAANRRG